MEVVRDAHEGSDFNTARTDFITDTSIVKGLYAPQHGRLAVCDDRDWIVVGGTHGLVDKRLDAPLLRDSAFNVALETEGQSTEV